MSWSSSAALELAAALATVEERLAAVELRLSSLDGLRPPPRPLQPGLFDPPLWECLEELSRAASFDAVGKVPTLDGKAPAVDCKVPAAEPVVVSYVEVRDVEAQVKEEEGEEERELLEYQLGQTLWDAPAVLFLPELGGQGVSAILLMSALLNALAQLYLVAVLLGSESFVRTDKWSELLDSTRRWRDNEAHQYTQVDAGGTSLAARVCGLDEALSTASEQSGVLQQINNYNGLQGRSMEATNFSTGPWLCTVCLFLWAVVIARELRDMATSTAVLLALPCEAATRLCGGRLMSLSGARRVAVVCMALLRLFVALALLYAGLMWLAHTSSTTDLILNAAALAFVLDTDELLMSTTVPSVVQRFLEDLKPVRYRRLLFYVEALLPTAFILVTVVGCVVRLIMPNMEQMLMVKQEMCGGPVDFAVSQNGAGIAVATRTNPFPADDLFGITERTVRELRSRPFDQAGETSNFAFVAANADAFSSFQSMSLEDFAKKGVCKDKDLILGGQRKVQKPYWFTAVSQATHLHMNEPYTPEGWHCADYARHCDNNTLVRVICPVTCGCNSPVSGQIYIHPSMGVPQPCLDVMEEWYASERPCADMDVASSPGWTRWWRAYETAMMVKFPNFRGDRSYAAFLERKIAAGCNDTTLDPITKTDFCLETSVALDANRIGGIRAFCPKTCCSRHPGHPHCPPNCPIRV